MLLMHRAHVGLGVQFKLLDLRHHLYFYTSSGTLLCLKSVLLILRDALVLGGDLGRFQILNSFVLDAHFEGWLLHQLVGEVSG